MFIQFADEREWLTYAFVIVGSGFAGQFLAERLSKTGRVLLLEAGGREDPLALGAGYYEIESSGLHMPVLGTRLSSFGGSSNHWTGQSHPFSPTVFKDRTGIAGWPIAYESPFGKGFN
jgi:choline dehydrogenase-like flavoprotein